MNPRQWYRFEAKADDASVVDIYVIDIIGDWIDELINEFYGVTATVTAKAFIDKLAKLPEAVTTIRVHINSPGGDVFAAVNIANALRDQQLSKGRAVATYIDGLAASAASVIAMAGKTVVIADNALLMIHNPWTIAIGESKDMRKAADTLDTVRGTIVATYKWHSSVESDDIAALMDAETWMTAEEALANGFATEMVEGLKAAASIDRRALATLKVPDQFKARVDALLAPPPAEPTPAAADVITRACADAGLDLAFANALIAEKPTADQVTARVQAEKTSREAAAEAARTAQATAAARATEITALCATAKMPTLAAGYIRGGMNVDDVRAHLTTVTALRDGTVEIDGTLPVDQGHRAKATLVASDIYAARNRNSKKE